MSDSEIIALFRNASVYFNRRTVDWDDATKTVFCNTKTVFCNFVRNINNIGLDWYCTGPNVTYPIRFGRKNPGEIGQVVGELKLTQHIITLRLQNWPESNLTQREDLNLSEQLINDSFITPNWPTTRLGTNDNCKGRWPVAINQ